MAAQFKKREQSHRKREKKKAGDADQQNGNTYTGLVADPPVLRIVTPRSVIPGPKSFFA